MKTTKYFRSSVLNRRPNIREEWISYVITHPIRSQIQSNGRIRCWAFIEEKGKYLRVIIEPDGETVHNAFFDRRFKP